MHAKAVLLVHDRQRQVGKGDLLLDQGVRSDNDTRGTLRGGRQCSAFLLAAEASGEPDDLQPKRRKPRGELAVMLLGQDLGRRHDRDLPPVLDALQGGKHGDHRLAAAHVALQQALHRMRRAEIAFDFAPGLALCARQLERQAREESARQFLARAQGGRPGAATSLVMQTHRQLLRKQLVEFHAAPRRMSTFLQFRLRDLRGWIVEEQDRIAERRQ